MLGSQKVTGKVLAMTFQSSFIGDISAGVHRLFIIEDIQRKPSGHCFTLGCAKELPFRHKSLSALFSIPGTPNNQKEMDVSPNNHFLCKGIQLPSEKKEMNHLMLKLFSPPQW